MARRTLSASRNDFCYDFLKSRIVAGDYGPGQRLVIDELRRESGASTIPWREAMQRLEVEGWVEIIPQVGARMTVFDAGEWERSLRLVARLEALATVLAASELSAKDLATARRTNQNMRQALTDFDLGRFLQLSKQFHTEICQRAPDSHLKILLDAEEARLNVIRRSGHTTAPGRAFQSVEEREILLDLLETGNDMDTIETFARQHKLNKLESVVRHDTSIGAPAA